MNSAVSSHSAATSAIHLQLIIQCPLDALARDAQHFSQVLPSPEDASTQEREPNLGHIVLLCQGEGFSVCRPQLSFFLLPIVLRVPELRPDCVYAPLSPQVASCSNASVHLPLCTWVVTDGDRSAPGGYSIPCDWISWQPLSSFLQLHTARAVAIQLSDARLQRGAHTD